MTQKKSRTQIASAVSLALSSMMLSAGLHAGIIENSNPAPNLFGACGADTSDQIACVGAWNLDNVQVNLIRVIDGTVYDINFNEQTGAYAAMTVGDSFRSLISDGDNAASVTGILSGKDWPVGEPTGIKAVNGDKDKGDGTPVNCLINTSYEGELISSTGADAYLDIAASEPVICSSGFQSHKRFKVAMQDKAVDAVDSDAIDLVFNVGADTATVPNPYQVFSKINNYTGKRLAGYKIQVGRGVGKAFQTASDLNIADQLYLSLGIGEETKTSTAATDLFDLPDGLANFSHGLFGPVEVPHFPNPGFFDDERAYYPVGQRCETAAGVVVTDPAKCPTLAVTTGTVPASDTVFTSGPLSANYTSKFGDWLPSIWAPKGLFTPDPVDATADPILQAWWNGTNWIKYDTANNYAEVVLTSADIQALVDKGATMDVIEDVLNLGPNYIVKVGAINTDGVSPSADDTFTVRIVPVVSADQTEPAWVSSEPPALPAPTTTTTSSGGGGCAVGGNGRFDPTLPALLAMGLGFFGWRRFKAGK